MMPSRFSPRVPLVLFAAVNILHAAEPAQPTSPVDVVALTHVRLVDGTSAPPKDDQTIIITGGKIAALGNAAEVRIPDGGRTLDLRGRTVMPGLVMLHEHLAYGAGPPDVFFNVAEPQPFSPPRLFLAYGVTTIRTAGTFHPYVDLNVKRRIDTGELPGPEMFLTAPYLTGPGTRRLDVKPVRTPEEARRAVRYWAQEGFSSIKTHGDVSKDALAAIIEEAHAVRLPVTAHLGRGVNCREAAEMGIDNLEHGFGPCNNLTTDDLGTDPDGPRARALVQLLVDKRVVLTVTPMSMAGLALTDSELELLHPSMRDRYVPAPPQASKFGTQPAATLMVPRLVVAFAKSGGLLVLGSDTGGCCGYGHFAGVANHSVVVRLVQYGFTPLEVIRIATLNGAAFLGIANRTGSVTVGKEADLLVVRGDPSVRIEDIKQVETVFSNGVQYDPATLLADVKGMVGWR